jgi:alkyl hydroperoxide reductase subunit AhpC
MASHLAPSPHHNAQEDMMGLQLGEIAPDFSAKTTAGDIRFHDWLGDAWGVLFSHPKDFTPVCTTELGYMAKIKPEFDRRGVKIIGLSVDSTADHERWAADIEETQGARPNYPVIGDLSRDRRRRLQRGEALRHAHGSHVRGRQEPHARGQPDCPQRVRNCA